MTTDTIPLHYPDTCPVGGLTFLPSSANVFASVYGTFIRRDDCALQVQVLGVPDVPLAGDWDGFNVYERLR